VEHAAPGIRLPAAQVQDRDLRRAGRPRRDAWHDIGLQLRRDAAGRGGLRVWVGGGMGRTPVIGTVFNDFVPWQQILVYIEAIVRVYNQRGRRDNLYKARIKILVKAEGRRFVDDVNAEFAALLQRRQPGRCAPDPAGRARPRGAPASTRRRCCSRASARPIEADAPPAYRRWLERNVHAHKVPRATGP
jgi:sulfite reductase (NADPH) hemoprotein beta-component